MIYNYYNRISTTRLVSKDRLSSSSIAVSKIGNKDMKRELSDDELYDLVQDVHNTRTYEMTREEKYDYIRKQVETQGELKDTIEKLCDNSISPNAEGKFYALDVTNVTGDIKSSIIKNDKKVLELLGFDNHITAWSVFFEWSCYGKIAYRIVYEYKTKEEIESEINDLKQELGVIDIKISEKPKDGDKGNATTRKNARRKLVESKNPLIKRQKLLEGVKYTHRLNAADGNDDGYNKEEVVATDIIGIRKINISHLQENFYQDDPDRKIYRYKQEYYDENEIIVIDYNYVDGNNLPATKLATSIADKKISYADNIIRSYNILNRIEVSIVAWTVLNSMYRQKMVIPLMTKVSSKAKEAISKVRNKYMDNFEVDNNGVTRINGESTFNYMKNIVLAERNGREPKVDTVQYSGWDLKNMTIPDYFRENFIRDAKMPSNRYNKDGKIGQLSMFKADGVPYDEINFYNYLDRILHQFGEILKKPTMLLTQIQHPSFEFNDGYKNSIRYKWESFSSFLEAKEAEKNTKILSNIDQMLRFTNSERELIFDPKYLFVKRFAFMTEDEWKENEKMKNESKKGDDNLS